MNRLSLRLDTASSPYSDAPIVGWQLPAGKWLIPNSTAGILAISAGPNSALRMLMTVEPGNGHHCIAACVTPSHQALAA
jgi:hypothetical protein